MTVKHTARLPLGPVIPYAEIAYDSDGSFLHLGCCICGSLRTLWLRLGVGIGPATINVGVLGPTWREATNTP